MDERKYFITFVRSAESYIVFCDGERIGWVRRDGSTWVATDTFMEETAVHKTRSAAVVWLRKRVVAVPQ